METVFVLLMMTVGLSHGFDIHPLVLQPARVVVRYGDSVSVNCSTSSSDHDGMGWEASVGGTDLMENVTYVTWTVESLTTWTIDPFCYINIGPEQPSKELPVTLYKTPDAVKISQVNGTGPMLEGTEYQLQCKILQVAPLQNLTVKWYRQNKILPVLPSGFDAADGLPKDAIHTISIIPSRTDHLAQYKCAAQLDLGPDGPQPPPTKTSYPLTVLVLHKPVIQDCPSHSSGVEHVFTLSMLPCLADGNPPATVRWYHGGRQVDASTPLTRMQSGTFILDAQNAFGQRSMAIDITIESPVSPPKLSYECLSQRQMRVSCSCEGDSVQYRWTLDGQNVTDEQLLSGHHDTQNITLIQGLSGQLACSVRNSVSSDVVSENISPCPAPVSPPKLSYECLSQGQMRVSCSCEGDSVQYRWTLDGQNLTDKHLLCGHHDTQNITLIQGLSGQLSCSVRNTFSSDAVSENISPCGGQSVYLYFKVAEMCVLLMVCVGFYIYYKMKTRPPPPQDPLYCNMVVMETQ